MKSIKKILLLALVSSLYMHQAVAEVSPIASTKNPHIQSINYDENIFKFYSSIGIVTTLEFDQDEVIKDFAMGDREAWNASFNGNLFVIKPKETKGSTNLTIYTSKRKYFFWVEQLSKNSPKVAYWLKVRSPDQQAISQGEKTPAMIAAEEKAAREEARRKELLAIKDDLKNAKNEGRINKDYWIVGSPALQPVAAEDNGIQTRLTFSAANALPVAFIIEADGSESIVDSHMEADTMVLHRVADKIILRRGNLVAGITNKNVNRVGMSSPTGTVSDKVERIILGEDETK